MGGFILEIQSAGALSDARRPEAGAWAVGGSGVEWGALFETLAMFSQTAIPVSYR